MIFVYFPVFSEVIVFFALHCLFKSKAISENKNSQFFFFSLDDSPVSFKLFYFYIFQLFYLVLNKQFFSHCTNFLFRVMLEIQELQLVLQVKFSSCLLITNLVMKLKLSVQLLPVVGLNLTELMVSFWIQIKCIN